MLASIWTGATMLAVAMPAAGQTYGPRRVNVAIDGAFKAQEYDDIRHAVEKWNIALANRMVFEIQSAPYQARRTEGTDGIRLPGLIFVRIDSAYPMVQGPAFKSTLAVAVGSVRSGIIYVLADRVAKRHLNGVSLHEVGHTFGIGHLPKGLMEPRYSPRAHSCIDALTLSAVGQAQSVMFDKHDWCH